MNTIDPLTTSDDIERKRQAVLVVAQMQVELDAAHVAFKAAEEACVDDFSDATFAKAKAARIAVDDAERALLYVRHQAAKIIYEVESAARAASKEATGRVEEGSGGDGATER